MVALPAEIQEKYGDLYVGENWNASYQNIRKGSIMNRSHKCGVCKKSVTKACYEHLHNAFCLAIVKDEDGHEVICGERFCVVSPKGCNQHPFNGGVYGYNKEIQQLAKGLVVDWNKLQERDPTYCGNDNKNEVSDSAVSDWTRKPWEFYNELNAQKYLDSMSHRKCKLDAQRRKSETSAKDGIVANPKDGKATGGKRNKIAPEQEPESNLKRVKCTKSNLVQAALEEVPENVDSKSKAEKRMKIKPTVLRKLGKKRVQY